MKWESREKERCSKKREEEDNEEKMGYNKEMRRR